MHPVQCCPTHEILHALIHPVDSCAGSFWIRAIYRNLDRCFSEIWIHFPCPHYMCPMDSCSKFTLNPSPITHPMDPYPNTSWTISTHSGVSHRRNTEKFRHMRWVLLRIAFWLPRHGGGSMTAFENPFFHFLLFGFRDPFSVGTMLDSCPHG